MNNEDEEFDKKTVKAGGIAAILAFFVSLVIFYKMQDKMQGIFSHGAYILYAFVAAAVIGTAVNMTLHYVAWRKKVRSGKASLHQRVALGILVIVIFMVTIVMYSLSFKEIPGSWMLWAIYLGLLCLTAWLWGAGYLTPVESIIDTKETVKT